MSRTTSNVGKGTSMVGNDGNDDGGSPSGDKGSRYTRLACFFSKLPLRDRYLVFDRVNIGTGYVLAGDVDRAGPVLAPIGLICGQAGMSMTEIQQMVRDLTAVVIFEK
jgi:hypothetical protein